jgi:hypothetical protein
VAEERYVCLPPHSSTQVEPRTGRTEIKPRWSLRSAYGLRIPDPEQGALDLTNVGSESSGFQLDKYLRRNGTLPALSKPVNYPDESSAAG